MSTSTPPKPITNAAPLQRVRGLTREQIDALREYWITSVQELLATADLPDGKRALQTILGVDAERLERLLSRAREVIGVVRGAERDDLEDIE